MPPLDINVQELIAQLDLDLAEDDDLAKVAEARRRATSLAGVGDQLIDHFVTRARAAGLPWSQIGSALGVTKQAAQQRFMAPTFERFTARAKQAVTGAQQRARELGSSVVEPEHVALSLLAVQEGVAAKALVQLAGPPEALEQRLLAALPGPTGTPPTHIPFGPEPKQAMRQALDQALELGHNYIGTEHLLLGLIAVPDGRVGALLAELGVSQQAARDAVLAEIDRIVGGRQPGSA